MNLSYNLPQELIAQVPKDTRDKSRMFFISRATGKIKHLIFKDLVNLLDEKYLLVLNNTKVFPARLFGRRESGGKVEVLFVKEREPSIWEIIGRPARRIKSGRIINFDHGNFQAEVLEDGAKKLLRFGAAKPVLFEDVFERNNVRGWLCKYGKTPLPPYIKRPCLGIDEKQDRMRYQTIYARSIGSCACPTAGLHFTKGLLNALRKKGVGIVEITLHVGPGTFRPIKADNLEEYQMEEESFFISRDAARVINSAKKKRLNIIACGTSTVRALEGAGASGEVAPGKGDVRLFIYPGYRFKIVNSLITNFHQPNSSPLALVNAFAGESLIQESYQEAIKEKYRFLSYGDAMLILD